MSDIQPTNSHQFSYEPDSDVAYRALDFMGLSGYRVGDDGSVWSCLVSVGFGKGGGRGKKRVPGNQWRKLREGHSSPRYHAVVLRRIPFRLNRLILAAFVGPCPDGKEGCHNDGNSKNNRLVNLRWDTRKANQADRIKHGTDKRGEKHPCAKLTESQVRQIRSLAAGGRGSHTRVQIAKEYGVSYYTVWEIVTRQSWAHIS